MFTLDFKAAKEGFFDREKVLRALDKARLKVFKEYGRKVRARAQKSLAYADRPSAPGQPPHAHRSRTVVRRSKKTGEVLRSKKTGQARKRSLSFLREYIYFSYDTSTRSVVIGPAKLSGVVGPDAPKALEYGGPSTVQGRGGPRRATIAARPFMHPAAAAEQPGLPALWRDSVR